MRTVLCLLALVTAGHFIGSCKKSAPSKSGPDTIKASRAVLSFMSFPENSYRIYKDSANGTLDSIVVVENKLNFEYNCCQTFIYTTYPPYYSEKLSIRWERKNPPLAPWLTGTASTSMLLPGNFSNAPVLFTMENEGSSPTSFIDENAATTSMSVEGRLFNNVMRMESSKYQLVNGTTPSRWVSTTYFYWAKNVGLIQRSYFDTATSKTIYLIRFN